ncbi:hypothetical protein BJ970_003635 [Saccharopolyspora phatthalungensis]|uniref:Uncharacterized protein n=1 Tax=Saccharopolyspora phatthalungensis TaxID=664693 RepID=A0A840Q8N1_9PSEU|nr:hypothetical protein [Saccharopolyspora phatthalungensis]
MKQWPFTRHLAGGSELKPGEQFQRKIMNLFPVHPPLSVSQFRLVTVSAASVSSRLVM